MAPTEQDYPQSPFNIETVLVTGGAGFIGSHTSTELLNRGYRVVVVDEMNDYYDIRIKERNLRELRKLKSDQDVFAFYKGDIGNEKFIKSVCLRRRPSSKGALRDCRRVGKTAMYSITQTGQPQPPLPPSRSGH